MSGEERTCEGRSGRIPFMVRYLTTNGISGAYDLFDPFTLRYRRVNGAFYETVKVGGMKNPERGTLDLS
jgi:hypothetical protein